MKRIAVGLAMGIAIGLPFGAAAQEVRLGRSGMSAVFVWRDLDSYREGIALIRAEMHTKRPELIMTLLSCLAKPGDRAVVIEPVSAMRSVLVTGGESEGCRGLVAMEDVGG